MLSNEQITKNINELVTLNENRMGKYRRNARRYNYTPFSSLEEIKEASVIGYVQGRYMTDSDLTEAPQYNVIKSCIDTLCSKVSQNKVRPMFNVQNGDFKAIQVVKNAQEFFDLYFDEQKVVNKVSEAFKEACIFDTGVIYIDEANKTINKALPWQVFVRPSDTTYNCITRVYYERKDYPTELIKNYKGKDEYCNYGLYYDTINKCKVEVINNKINKTEKYDKKVIPFVFLHYNDPITGNSSQSVADMLNSLQVQINKTVAKTSTQAELSAGTSYFVPEGSSLKAGMLTNRTGTVYTYKPSPNMSGSPVTVSQNAPFDAGWLNYLNDLVQKAYEMVGITQLSAQGAKPVGVDSGAAMNTLENIESERYQIQVTNYIHTFVDISKTCILVFDENDDILPEDKNRVSITWKDIVKESDRMFIQYSAGDALGNTPAQRQATVAQYLQMGIISSSRAAQLLETADLTQGYNLANNALKAVMRAIDNVIDNDDYEIPDFVPKTLLKEEIINTQLSLYSCGNEKNIDAINKLQILYDNITEMEQQEQAEQQAMMPPVEQAPVDQNAMPVNANTNMTYNEETVQ